MSAAHVVVREATSQRDLVEVRRLILAYADSRADTLGVEHMRADAERLPGPYAPPQGALWLAVHGERGVGCVAMRVLDDGAAEVRRMFVDAEWRGRGVGRALLEALVARARARGFTVLRLGTLDDMHAAQALYCSLGFTPVARYRPDELAHTRFYELPLT